MSQMGPWWSAQTRAYVFPDAAAMRKHATTRARVVAEQQYDRVNLATKNAIAAAAERGYMYVDVKYLLGDVLTKELEAAGYRLTVHEAERATRISWGAAT